MTPETIKDLRQILRTSWLADVAHPTINHNKIKELLKIRGNELLAEAVLVALARTTDLEGHIIFGLDFPQELLPSLTKNLREQLANISIPPGATGI